MSVGQTLAAARDERRLSLEDISASTRIRASLIRDIEADDFHSCGGAVYARGHIRSIARVIGIDAEPLIAEFDSLHRSEDLPILNAITPLEGDDRAIVDSKRRPPNWAAAIAAALVIIIVGSIIGLTHGPSNKPKGSELNAGNRPQTGVTTPSTPVNTTPPKLPNPGTAELNRDEASMLIRASQTTWLEVKNNRTGQVLTQGLLDAGKHRLFTSRTALYFIIGNAPGVDVVVNGNDIGAPKSENDVARGVISPGSNTIQQA